MKKTYIGFAGLSLVLLLGTQQVQAQQGFGTDKPAKSAAVDIQSSKRGLLIPRVDLVSTTNGTLPIEQPAQSLMVYNEKTQNDVTPGYYYWDTNRWVRFAQQGDISAINLAGDVTGPTNATIVGAIQGTSVSNTNPTANQVLMFDDVKKEWVPTILSETSIISSKGITATGITVGGEGNGAGSTLKDVTLAITPGGKNQVMVTNAAGDGTTWVDQTEIAPNTTHTLTKEGTDKNTLVSTVNGVIGSAEIIDNVSNTITNNTTLTTTVNGVKGELDLTPAIQAGQKTTTVVPQDEKVTVVTTGSGTNEKNTEYTVGVDQTKFDLSKIGGSLLTTQITPGVDGQILTTVGGDTPSVEWANPAVHENIFTHDGTLVSTDEYKRIRNVDFGTFYNLKFKSGDQSHQFTYDDTHTGLNMYGNTTSSIGLISNTDFNSDESKLKISHTNKQSVINSNSEDGLKVIAEHKKAITFSTTELPAGSNEKKTIENVIFYGDGSVRIKHINKDEFKGAATDKVVVADAAGVLKTVERTKVAPQFFYMPAVIFNTKTTGTGNKRDLYQEYVDQFTGGQVGPGNATYNIAHGVGGGSLPYNGGLVGSSGAPDDIDVFGKRELFYYVTYYDTKVFANLSIDADGVLTYDIIGNATPASYMNIVFVIK